MPIRKIRAFLRIYLYSLNMQWLDDHPNDLLVLFIPHKHQAGWIFYTFHFILCLSRQCSSSLSASLPVIDVYRS